MSVDVRICASGATEPLPPDPQNEPDRAAPAYGAKPHRGGTRYHTTRPPRPTQQKSPSPSSSPYAGDILDKEEALHRYSMGGWAGMPLRSMAAWSSHMNCMSFLEFLA